MMDRKNTGTVGLCGEKIAKFMHKKGWSNEKLASEAKISPSAISLLRRNKNSATWSTAEKLRVALDLDSIDQIRPTSDPNVSDSGRINEWQLVSPLTKWVTTSNQLQFRIWQLEHLHLSKMARGKCYDLVSMSSADRKNCKTQLLRHAEVCTRIKCDHVIRNLTTYEEISGERWWVIDEWLEGSSLAEIIGENRMRDYSKKTIAVDVAQALLSMNEQGIVCRELSPSSIVVRKDGAAVLTEFELAKLLDGSPTVATDDWRVDPYRAPEAASDDINVRADIYSWGRIMSEIFLGELPEVGKEAACLKNADLPPGLIELITKCVSVSRRSRPSGFNEVIELLVGVDL